MSSWVLLLWTLAACVRFACTEGDPLPPALVELVRTSSISSIQDLQLLLEPDSVDEDPDSQTSKRRHANGTSKRLPRSLVAEEAQQARCKVRTEVLEVTRDMLDRRNANFMLWPPCVEVQRCSGCCNSRTVHCVPIVTRTRYLQVMKIQYINRNPHYEKAIISVQDHMDCRCQTTAPPPAPRTTPRKPQHAVQPQRPAPKAPPLKTLSKEELHREDELKQNQNRNQNPSLRPANRVPPRPPTAQTHAHTSPSPVSEERAPTEPPRGEEGREPRPTQDALQGDRTPGHRRGDGSAVRPHGEHRPHTHPHGLNPHGLNPNITSHHSAPQRPTEGEHRPHTHHTQAVSPPQQGGVPHNHDNSHNDSHNHNHNQNHNHNHSHSHSHSHSHDHNHDCKHNQTEATEQRQPAVGPHRDRELPGTEGGREQRLNIQEEQELLLLQRKLDQEKEQLKQQEELQRHHHQQQHHLHHRGQVHTTTQRPVTTTAALTAALTTERPPPTRRPPARRGGTRRRPRKNRRRISKATMRAMLM
ncbi:platelet-derived growth factor beta polypeptide a [Conger conger]|uniref:platelet-derived growth factor beta polypeptide a n=1 Tax=Conger conger TaxID=82655 RepID=UPI002A5AFBEF|nr:platelet-derived growth factor beta polypeptide a [Conger conger]